MRSPVAALDLRAALTDEVRTALDELSGASINAKTIHRCRVRLKRARALARVGHAVAPGLSAVFNASARTIMHKLSEARDLAALSACARWRAQDARGKTAAALGALADTLDDQRLRAPEPDLDGARAGLRDLLALAQVWPEASSRQIARGAARLARRARRAYRRAAGSRLPANRHRWRKREKDRLYAAELLGPNWPHGLKRRRRKNAKLAEALGQERDLILLIHRLEAAPEAAGDQRCYARARRSLSDDLKRAARGAERAGRRLHASGA